MGRAATADGDAVGEGGAGDGRAYPWGNEKPTDKLCNFDQNVGGTTPVGRYSSQGDSPYGCVDMSGNVWEWCLNKYGELEDTAIDRSGDIRALRGGSWLYDRQSARVSDGGHHVPDYSMPTVGFRPVSPVDSGS